MYKTVLALLVVAVALVSAATIDEDLVIREDPYLQRVVEEAVEMGENSVLDLAMGRQSTSHSYESPVELESSLLAISSEILGTPAPRPQSLHARAAAAAYASSGAAVEGSSFVSMDESASFEALLGSSEEERLIAAKKAELAADKAENERLLGRFEALSATVDKFHHALEEEAAMSFADATVSAEEAAEAEQEEAEASAADAEEQEMFEADVQSHMDSDDAFDLEAAVDERISARETPAPAAAATSDAALEAEYDLSAFLELESLLSTASAAVSRVHQGSGADAEAAAEAAAAALESALSKLSAPSAEEEALEPTLSEEAEAAAEGSALPTASFLLTEEELVSQLEALHKEFAAVAADAEAKAAKAKAE